VEVDKALLIASTGLVGDLHVGHDSPLLSRRNHTLVKLLNSHFMSSSPVMISPKV
jgi:hypothetical protein